MLYTLLEEERFEIAFEIMDFWSVKHRFPLRLTEKQWHCIFLCEENVRPTIICFCLFSELVSLGDIKDALTIKEIHLSRELVKTEQHASSQLVNLLSSMVSTCVHICQIIAGYTENECFAGKDLHKGYELLCTMQKESHSKNNIPTESSYIAQKGNLSSSSFGSY